MKIATIGTSMITDTFIEATKDAPSVTIAAVYSRSLEKARRFAEKHQVEKVYIALEEIAEDTSIDCVYIASPNGLHFEQTVYFLENNKHVICEKPIFSNVAEWEKAHEIADKHGVFLFEGMRNIHMPNFHILAEKISLAGEINHVTLNFAKYSSRYDNVLAGEEPNIFSLGFAGGALVDLGVYPLSIAVGLFGKPQTSCYYPVKIRTGVDGSGTLVLRYADFVCTILTSKISTSYTASEIQGQAGTFIIDNTGTISKVSFYDNQDGSVERIGKDHKKHEMAYEIIAFHDIITSNNMEAYTKLKQISLDVLEITEKVRKENEIIYRSEK